MDPRQEPFSYTFSPRPRAGIIAGFSGKHLLVAGVGGLMLLVLLLVHELGGAVIVGILVALLVLVPVGPGERLFDLLEKWSSWGWRMLTGRARRDEPQPIGEWQNVNVNGLVWGVRQINAATGQVWVEIEKAPEFALRSSFTQDQILAEWGAWLDSLGREGSPVKELTWVEVASPVASGGAETWAARHLAPRSQDALNDYLELLDTLAATATEHRAFLRLTISPRSTRVGLLESVAQTASLLRSTVRPFMVHPLAAEDVVRLVESFFVYGAASAAGLRRSQGKPLPPPEPIPPLIEDIGQLRIGHQYVAVWWASELPRIAIRADGFAPLLAVSMPCVRIVWSTLRPLPPWRAERRAEANRTQMESELAAKQKEGFTPKLSEERELAALERRTHELLSGHAMMHHTTAIAVIAPTQAILDEAVTTVESAAGTCGIILKRQGPRSRKVLGTLVPEIAA